MTVRDEPVEPKRVRLSAFVFEGDEVPLLLRPRVLVGLVVGFLLIVAAYAFAARTFGISWNIDAEPFQEWVDQWGLAGPIVFMAVMAISVLFAPIPNVPIFIAAGLAWGPVLGTAYSMVGMMIGSTAAFWVARRLGRRHLPKLIGRRAANTIDNLALTMGGRVVFWARMMPVVNFDFISFFAGLTAIRFWPFFVYSFFGMLLPTSVAVIAGDSLGKDIRITFALGGLWVAAIVLSAAYFWWRRGRMHTRGALRTAVEPDEG